jgi:hypothetical protein
MALNFRDLDEARDQLNARHAAWQVWYVPAWNKTYFIEPASLSGRAAGQFGDDIQVADVARVLLEQMEQNPLQ